MKKKFKHPINYLAVFLAIVSFSVGTFLWMSYKITGEMGFMVVGYYHVLGAGLLNTIMLIILLFNVFLHLKEYKENLFTIVILISNIPVTVIYMTLL